tara:strand:+ start:414 stop:551 length:138 start_codon:yes stop_codon:yes gene_type:complete
MVKKDPLELVLEKIPAFTNNAVQNGVLFSSIEIHRYKKLSVLAVF